MKVGAWNVEGLSEAKQDAVIAMASDLGLDAVVLYETWLRPQRGPLQPRHALWHRLDVLCTDLHANAPRGKGGISLLAKHSVQATLYRHCPSAHWCIWTTSGATITGVYVEPSVRLPEYQATLDDLVIALADVMAHRQRPQIVVGDFNARLGADVGDHVTNTRRSATRGFAMQAHLELLNVRLANHQRRYTWCSAEGRSVVDLAFTRGASSSALNIRAPPMPTPHQLLIVDIAVTVEEVIADPSRWAWSRRAFSDLKRRQLCSELLAPTMSSMARLWDYVRLTLDAQVADGGGNDENSLASAQELVDEAYTITCRAIRCSLLGMACWDPERARRGHQAQRHVDWSALAECSDGFFLSSVKSALQTVQAAAPGEPAPYTVPTAQAFASFYADLYAASPATPIEPHQRSRRETSSLDEAEKKIFCVAGTTELLSRAKWKKAIGPDNMPADVFKCCASSAAEVLHRMFLIFWTHQVLPAVWRKAFVVPIEKKGADLNDPAQWRGIALQSHLKKLFEVQVRKLCRNQGWTRVHVLQTGFQPKTGAIESVYVVDELTRKYEALGQPLSLALLDVRKAYDRTPRAFIFRKLRRRGMPEHAIGVVQALLDSCQVVLRVNGEQSEPVSVQVGVPQGDVLSPDMFNVFVDDLAERLLVIGRSFGGCPTYGDMEIPLIMYADDQTLMHWRPDALQAMLREAERYAEEHQYAYNVNKCVVTHPESNAAWPPLRLNGSVIPVSETTSLLGVKLTRGLVDHDLQLEDRLEKAKRAINGLEMLGAFRTPELSIARKRLILIILGRSRVEYGMPIAPHTKADLRKVDSWMMEMTEKCLGGGRGTSLSMRFCGIIPAHARMAQLRMRFLRGLRFPCEEPGVGISLAAAVFRKATAPPNRRRDRGSQTPRDPPSVIRRLVRYMPIIDTKDELAKKYAAEFKAAHLRDPDSSELRKFDARASSVALRKLVWDNSKQRLKLLPLQLQDFGAPFPAAYLPGDGGQVIGRWMTNLLPGNGTVGKPCLNCDGRYQVSRYHITRCTDSASRLGSFYCPIVHASHFLQVDNPVDAMIMDLVPQADRQDRILNQLDKCPVPPPAPRPAAGGLPAPALPRPRPVERLRPWRDQEWIERALGISSAIVEISRLSCPRTAGTGAAPITRSRTRTRPDCGRGDDRGTTTQAFTPHGAMAVGMFTAGRRHASPPVLPPAR
jgi:hypothetical protein